MPALLIVLNAVNRKASNRQERVGRLVQAMTDSGNIALGKRAPLLLARFGDCALAFRRCDVLLVGS
jgi:hypothetical protein